MVIMAIGVVPETKIVKNTEIATNSRGAIIVNDKMETSIKDIYAVGDAIEIKILLLIKLKLCTPSRPS